MKNVLKPSVCLAIGFILLFGMGSEPRTAAQPPPLPAPGVDSPPTLAEADTSPVVESTVVTVDDAPYRFGLSHQIFDNAIDDPFTDLRFFIPSGDDDQVLFFDGRLILGNNMSESGLGYNLGVGARTFSEDHSAV